MQARSNLSHTDIFDANTEFHVAITSETFNNLKQALSNTKGPNAGESERGAYCIVTRSTGYNRVTYLVQEVVTPEEGEVYWSGYDDETREGLQFEADYRDRAVEAASEVDGAGIMLVHTHPRGQARPSPGDYPADAKDLYTAAQRLEENAPLAAAVWSESGSWHVRACEMQIARTPGQRDSDAYGPDSAMWHDATAIRVVGDTFEKLETTTGATGPEGTRGPIDSDLVESSEEIWGGEGHEQLAGLRVGVIGCGGGGSILAEWLPRLGVGELVLVDFDRLEKANFNRHQGSIRADIDENRLKVRVSARVAKQSAVAEQFEVRPVVGSVVESAREEYDPLKHVLDCDVIFNAADPHWARNVVDDIAHAHLIPVIDAGSDLDTNADGKLTSNAQSNVSIAGPGHPCLECADMYDPKRIGEEKEGVDPEPYLDEESGDDEDGVRAPSVISMNGFVESLALQRLQALTLGVAPEMKIGVLRYLPASASLRWRMDGRNDLNSCKESCKRTSDIVAAGDTINEELDRYVDPRLSEQIEDGLEKSGVVAPAASGVEEHSGSSGTDEYEKPRNRESETILSRIRKEISHVLTLSKKRVFAG